MSSAAEQTLTLIRAAVEPRRVVVDPDVMAGLSRDRAVWAPAADPIAVVRAASTAEVRAVVAACAAHGVPVVARGAGTGLSGGANAVAGGVVLSLESMNRIRRIDVTERLAVVEPGVVNDHLRAAAAEHGLWYAPDPASSPWSTIGGNIATNAGGVCCVKYGVTRDHVLELEVVTGTGEVVRVGRRTAKGVVGYDLVGLLVGSEGTLGIVTEATVRLLPTPGPTVTIAGGFGSLVEAGRATRAVAAAGLVPAALELVDRQCLEAVDRWKNMGLAADAEAVLLARVDDPPTVADAAADRIVEIFTSAGASWATRSTDAAESEALFAARRLAFVALERLGQVLTEDVCVPLEAVPEALARIQALGRDHDVTIANIAHIGDGNLHPLILTPIGDEAAGARARTAFEAILDVALDLGGTVSGEHGIGLLKRSGMRRELSPAVLDLHRAIKQALDPQGILNPGKAIG